MKETNLYKFDEKKINIYDIAAIYTCIQYFNISNVCTVYVHIYNTNGTIFTSDFFQSFFQYLIIVCECFESSKLQILIEI